MDKPPREVDFNYTLTVRRPARLNLTINGSPTPELTLYKQLESGTYVKFTSERFNVSLIGIMISSVEPEDAGNYRLTASYETYNDSEDFSIIVNSK